VESLLRKLPSRLSDIVEHITSRWYESYDRELACKELPDNDSSSTTTTTTNSGGTPLPTDAAASGRGNGSSSSDAAAGAAATSSSSSSTRQRISCALQAIAAAESCARALAATSLAADLVVRHLQALAAYVDKLQEGAVSWVQAALLPSNSSEAEHAQQQLREAQLPALFSIIKAMPINRSADWAFAEGAQQLFDAMCHWGGDDEVAEACLQLSRINSSSSSSGGDSRLAGAMSVLLLCARWLHVRALQLQLACNMEPVSIYLQQLEIGAADTSPAASIVEYNAILLEAVQPVVDAAGYAAEHLRAIILSCSDARGVTSASGNTASSSSSGSMASSSSNAVAAVEALQQLQQQVQELHSCAESVLGALDAAWHVSGALAGRRVPVPVFTAGSDADEHERCRSKFCAASSSAELWQVSGSYDALWQLPGCALLLSEQLLAGLPCDRCCNNPGCINTAGRSERALVGGKSCKCAGCRTARWVLGT
jgi:hypothetical protein